MHLVKKSFVVASALSLFALTIAPRANAADAVSLRPLDRSTVLTFSGPVSLPTVTLPAGTYLFRFADPAKLGSTVLQVMDKDAKVVYATLHTIPVVRTSADDKSEIVFKENAKDAPPQIGAWYFDDSEGCELIYSRK
jgi:hypothetical protein